MKSSRKHKAGMAELQKWFGEAIARPLPDRYAGNPLAVSAPATGAQAAKRLWSRGGMSGFERLGVYNEQYWFRLITIMQEEYPCTVHLMGLRRFNEWAVRYLEACPPASPFLSLLDARFPAFLARRYRERDRARVLQAVAYERAFSQAVDAPAGDPPKPGADLAKAKLGLSPHVTPLAVDWDFAAYRALCLADESLEARIPLARARAFLVIYRDKTHRMQQAEIPRAAFRVLDALRNPATLPRVFSRLEKTLKKPEREELAAHLTAWFREWTALGWIAQNTMPTPQRLRKDSR